MDGELKVFIFVTETHVAHSVEDALLVFKEMIGDDYVADGYGEADDWGECNPDGFTTIFFGDERTEFPADRFEVLEKREGYLRIKATYKDWAAWNGRGFLCSTEF